jgi:hypothetical protein
MQPAQPEAIRLLVRAAGGDHRAADELVPLVYDEAEPVDDQPSLAQYTM